MNPTAEPNHVYRPPGWEAVAALFDGMDRTKLPTIGAWLSERADRLLAGWQVQDSAAARIVSNWHPEWVGRPEAEMLAPRQPLPYVSRTTDCQLPPKRISSSSIVFSPVGVNQRLTMSAPDE